MIPHWLIDGRTLRALSRFTVGAAVLAGLGVLVCLGKAYIAVTQVKASQAATASAKAALDETNKAIEAASSIRAAESPGSKKVLESFQSTTYAMAAKHGATVSELSVNTEVVPYLSKFTNDLSDGWSQVSVRFSLRGASQDVIRTLTALRSTDIPIEMDLVEINRSGWDLTGTAEVTALVQLRLLMRA